MVQAKGHQDLEAVLEWVADLAAALKEDAVEGLVEVAEDRVGAVAEVGLVDNHRNETAMSPDPPPEHRHPATKLLVIDDDQQICQLLTRYFSLQGYEVRSVSRGEEALALAKVFLPHVVLLDLLMPGMDGVETLRQLKQLTPTPKIIMLSGANLDEVAQGAIKLGADAYVCKPIKPQDLEHLINAFWPSGR